MPPSRKFGRTQKKWYALLKLAADKYKCIFIVHSMKMCSVLRQYDRSDFPGFKEIKEGLFQHKNGGEVRVLSQQQNLSHILGYKIDYYGVDHYANPSTEITTLLSPLPKYP